MRCKGGLRHLRWVAWRKSKEQCEWGIGAPEETHSSGANRCMGFSSSLRKEHKGERLDTAFFIYKKISAMALEARFFYNIVRPVGSLSMVTFLWWEWLEIGRIRSVVCGKICLAHGTVLFFSSFLMRSRLVQLFFFIARLFVTTCPTNFVIFFVWGCANHTPCFIYFTFPMVMNLFFWWPEICHFHQRFCCSFEAYSFCPN